MEDIDAEIKWVEAERAQIQANRNSAFATVEKYREVERDCDARFAKFDADLADLRARKAAESRTVGQRMAEELVVIENYDVDRIGIGRPGCRYGCTDGRDRTVCLHGRLAAVRQEIAAAIDKAVADRTENIAKQFDGVKTFIAGDLARIIRETK